MDLKFKENSAYWLCWTSNIVNQPFLEFLPFFLFFTFSSIWATTLYQRCHGLRSSISYFCWGTEVFIPILSLYSRYEMLICNLWFLVPYLMTQNPSPANLLFNVCKLSLCHPSKTSKSATGLCSATSPTMCRQCLLLVSWKEIYQMLKMLKHLPTRPTRVHRKQSSGYQRFTPKGMLRSLEIFPSELGQGKKVCDSILPWNAKLTITGSS